MARLSIWLAPFSPDYSGAASVFFDLNAVSAMHDASGCTGNYTGFDEPRWYGSSSAIYCSGLREIDLIMGDDEKLVSKMLMAGADLKPDIFALIGSPAPMVAGCDLNGIARELEARSGVVSLGIDTTGTEYYDRGVFLAVRALLERFAEKGETRPGTVNIVGVNPMDFGQSENFADLKSLLSENGLEIISTLSMDYGLSALRDAPKAQVNLAVSRAGFLIARYMEERYGQPWLASLPIGRKCAASYIGLLRQIMADGKPRAIKGESASGGGTRWLIVGEQVQSDCIRNALGAEYGETDVTVGAIFGLEAGLAAPGDTDLPDERAIKGAINSDRYDAVIADPFLYPLLDDPGKRFLHHTQYAVSSKLGSAYKVDFIGGSFNEWYENSLSRGNVSPKFLDTGSIPVGR
ncbi:MAG: hypothetical protein LBL73_12205 [Synergistaceae bacterium]|jgi:hypothetical protein|nr:hypothetical protein [Synergistaceae bacterium]